MARMPGVRRVFRLPSSEGRVAGEVQEEIAFHLEERVRELTARGINPDAARSQALREFGNVREAQQELEEIGRRRVRSEARTGWWSDLRQDVRYGLRSLLRSPGFTVVAVLTLALGIGATTAIYTVVDTVLLRPLGVADAERLVVLREYETGEEVTPPRQGGTVSPANFFDWQAQAQSFSSMAYFVQRPLNLTGDGEPQQAQVQLVSANFFNTLGVQPVRGRGFRPDEDAPGERNLNFGNVAVISHGLWQNRYGGDPAILGKTIQVAGDPYEVVGVMGPDVRVMDQKPDLWIPVGIMRGNRTTMGRFITGVGRLKPGVSFEQAQQEMTVIGRRLQAAYPEFNAKMAIDLVTMREQVVGDVRPALLVLLAAVGVLLLIASTNVANLLLGRASARRQEIAVRLSLGATRARLVRQLLTESMVLSLVGGIVGVAAAAAGTRALVRALPESLQLPRLDVVSLDGRVLAVALGVTLLTGILFGLAPALVSSRTDLQGALRDSGRGNTSGRAPMRLRSLLVVSEVALALMLLVSAGLLLRSFQKLQAVDTGIRPEGVLTLRMELGGPAYREDAAATNFVAQLLPALKGLPGVQSVGTVSHLPLTEGKTGHTAYRPDRPAPEAGQEPAVDIRVVGGDYFAAQGVRLLRGRTFDERDDAGAAPTFVINETVAKEQFPNEDPIGKQFGYPWPEMIQGEIIGVVADVHETSITDKPAQAVYRNYPQWPGSTLNVLLRTTGDPMALARAAQDQVHRIDPNLPVASVRTMESVVSEATARPRLSSYLLAGFAGMALLLAAIGLYGVISYGVVQRRGEIGVRVALGANRGSILGLIVKQGMLLTAVGLVVGLVGAFALTRLLRSLLFGVTTSDPVTFLAVPLVLAAAALLASYLPANRAARTDPAIALRSE